MRIAIFAPQEDDLCVAEAFSGLKTEYIELMPDIKHKHFSTASDEDFFHQLVGQLTIV